MSPLPDGSYTLNHSVCLGLTLFIWFGAFSISFSAWNASIYVNQMDYDKVMLAEKSKNYKKIVEKIISKNKGLFFYNEIFVIEKK